MSNSPPNKKVHLYFDGSDFYECGVAGPKYAGSKDPTVVNCLRCLKHVRREDDGSYFMRAHTYSDGTFQKRSEMPWVQI